MYWLDWGDNMSDFNHQFQADLWLDMAKERQDRALQQSAAAHRLHEASPNDNNVVRQQIGHTLSQLGQALTDIGQRIEQVDQQGGQTGQPDPAWK